MLRIRLLFFSWYILESKVKLHQLVEALFCGLIIAPEIPWRVLPQEVFGGDETLQTMLDGDCAQGARLVCQALLQLQDLFLSLCN